MKGLNGNSIQHITNNCAPSLLYKRASLFEIVALLTDLRLPEREHPDVSRNRSNLVATRGFLLFFIAIGWQISQAGRDREVATSRS